MPDGPASGRALADAELAALYGPLAHYASLIVAVSGGPDSMALMLTLSRWAAGAGGTAPHLLAATVDHGLRAESAEEAGFVAAAAARLGLAHRTLVWQGGKPSTAIQETAREARYALLAEVAAGEAQPAAVVTAHHAEDQAETVVMRLARGSGLDGLAGMAPVRMLGGVDLVRPLLGVPKPRLVATIAAHGLAATDDPSNDNPAFERVRLRRAWPALEAAGLGTAMIGRSAARLERARRALETATDALAADIADDHGGAYAAIDATRWRLAPEELRIRLLGRALAAFGGAAPPARLSQIESLAAALWQGPSGGVTLGGCVVVSRGGALLVYREAGRDGLPALVLQPGRTAVWDRRFAVGCTAMEQVEVRPLGAAEVSRLRTAGLDLGPMPAEVAATLPSFWCGPRLLGVPHLALGDAVDACKCRFLLDFHASEAN